MLTDLQLPVGARITPAFTLTIKNKVLEENISARIISLSVTDNSGFTADTLNLTFDDSDGQLQMPVRGTVLHLHLGWSKQALYDCGYFTVDTVTHSGSPDKIGVVARSADFRGSFDNKISQSYDDYTLGAIVRIISSRNKLDLPVIPQELDSVKIPHIDQTSETDSYFLTRLAQRYGAQVTVKNGAILFFKAGTGRTSSGQAIPWKTIVRSDGDNHNYQMVDKKAYDGVKAQWHDLKTATTSNVALKRSPAEGKEAQPASYIAGSGTNVLELGKIFPDEETAKRAADSVFNQIQNDAATFSIRLALGRADLSAQSPVNVQGFKDVIDSQRWVIDSALHEINEKGFTTKLILKPYVADITYQSSILQL
ncbi:MULTISPECIES: contractile injection system protein, VgrG/Pvc8 family [Rahnella]|jgi:Phage protein D|uniref:Putative prophage tail protein n=1 Tax=Rahnella sp. (strain Y9602) TaxID=2703885 RepID=A0A0H3F8M6_RAHSY|nr:MULTISPECIES: contractile injection system protein, VgrG/Pvc8 family [Rahnella]ADW72335.1 putative prophage tail protein [Rahnella aceris]MCM2446615.1 phage tail protein [Rahnella sp. CG8]NIA90593.1 phage tail protein [Rahnella aceris]UNK51735.1 phage tail protein [Rahnella aceris]